MPLLSEKTISEIKTLADLHRDNQADREFVMRKFAEECAEVIAELLQKISHPTHQGDEELLNEVGDLIFRLNVYMKQRTPEELEFIKNRIEHKVERALKKHMQTG